MSDKFIDSRKSTMKNTNDRITVEALKYYVPIFQLGDAAYEKLQETDDLSNVEINSLETQSFLRDLAVDKIASLAGPLITRELNKIIKGSHLNGRENLFDILYYAGINGMIKGLRHFDVNKLNKSSTNYLFQWIVTYAKKELNVLEAPFGIAPSRFQRYKKISAVRKKLSEEYGRYASNDEVLEYFLSGNADLKTMHGKLEKSDKPYASNQNMTLELVEEQENFEQNLNHTDFLDPLEDYSADIKMSESSAPIFDEMLLGTFASKYNFTDEALAVLLSDLQIEHIPTKYQTVIASIDHSVYKNISGRWKDLLKDINGPFTEYLRELKDSGSGNFNVDDILKSIESENKVVKPGRYSTLFVNKKVVKK